MWPTAALDPVWAVLDKVGRELLLQLLHHAHVLTCGPRSWRTKVQTDLRTEEATK
jgi:hypothetical protein